MRARGLGEDAAGGLFVALASFQFGGVVVLGKIGTDRGVSVAPMLSVRFAIAAALLAGALRVSGGSLRPAKGEGWRLAGLGLFGYAVEALLFFLAVDRGSASAVTLLFFTYPVVVTVLATALGRARLRPVMIGALAAAVAGAALVIASVGGLDISATGIGLALGSAAAFALYLIGAEIALQRTSSLAGALWVSASASAGLGIFAATTGGSLPSDAAEWGAVAGMGACTAGAFFCLFAGLRLLGVVRTAIVAALEPLSTALLAVAFLGEQLRAGTIGGGVLILAGALAASVARGERAGEIP